MLRKRHFTRIVLVSYALSALPAALFLSGCATSSPTGASTAQAAPEASPEPPYELVVNGIVDSALDDLSAQMRRLPGFASSLAAASAPAVAVVPRNGNAAAAPRILIVVDQSVAKAGLPSVASGVLDSLLLQTAQQKWPQFEVAGASPAVMDRAKYILGGKLTPLDAVSTSRGSFRIDLLLTDVRTSDIVAQSSVRFTATGVDLRPLWTGTSH